MHIPFSEVLGILRIMVGVKFRVIIVTLTLFGTGQEPSVRHADHQNPAKLSLKTHESQIELSLRGILRVPFAKIHWWCALTNIRLHLFHF